MIYGMATGAFHTWGWDMDRKLAYHKELGCQAVELTFATKEEFYEMSLGKESIDYLNSLDFVSIHLPFKHTYLFDHDTRKLIDDALQLGEKIGVKHFTIHHHNIRDFNGIQKLVDSSYQVSFENLKKSRGYDMQNYDALLMLHPRFTWVLDTTHALTFSEDHLDELISWLDSNGRLAMVHLSNYVNGKEHRPLGNDAELLGKIKHFDVPVIVEPDYDKGDFDSPKKDMEFLRRNSG